MPSVRCTLRGLGVAATAVAVLTVIGPIPAGAVTTSTTSTTSPVSAATASPTVWLCRPGVSPDPCAGNLSYSVVPAKGRTTVVAARPAAHPPIACFYVYPTVSGESTPNADLTVQPAESATAAEQVAPLSQDCQVYAPMYRQMTLSCLRGLQGGNSVCSTKNIGSVVGNLNVAYTSLLQGFRSFLALVPPHTRFVLMGHSQGAAMLIRLIKNVVDPSPALRSRLVSAILLGGNLTVPKGKLVGGAFSHIPLCSSARQVRCAIAYSSFYSQPPAQSNFGIPGKGVSFMWLDVTRSPRLQVACVAPNQLLGQAWTNPRFRSGSGAVPYVTYPKLYQAHCQYTDGRSFLHVTAPTSSVGGRPTVTASLGAAWGLHLWDPNLTLGDLVQVVAMEAAAGSSRS